MLLTLRAFNWFLLLQIFQMEVIEEIRENIQGINQSRTPNHYIGEYAVFELLGTGAFGSVYKVRRRTARQSFMAMKEVWPFFLLFTVCTTSTALWSLLL